MWTVWAERFGGRVKAAWEELSSGQGPAVQRLLNGGERSSESRSWPAAVSRAAAGDGAKNVHGNVHRESCSHRAPALHALLSSCSWCSLQPSSQGAARRASKLSIPCLWMQCFGSCEPCWHQDSPSTQHPDAGRGFANHAQCYWGSKAFRKGLGGGMQKGRAANPQSGSGKPASLNILQY